MTRNSLLLSLILFWCTLGSCLGQSPLSVEEIRKDLRFVEHLMANDYHGEAVYELERIKKLANDTTLLDSVQFLLGINHYNQRELKLANTHFASVTNTSKVYLKSRFYASFNYAYLGDYSLAKNMLEFGNDFVIEDSLTAKLKLFESAGISLLERDFEQFDKCMLGIGEERHYAIANECEKFLLYKDELVNQKNRKPWKAAVFSTLLPGLGKLYAGKPNEGFASFLAVGILGGATYEAYRQNTARPPTRFWILGSLFSVFYFGNILGSYYTVSVVQEEFNDEIDHKVTFDMHIPIRTIFN